MIIHEGINIDINSEELKTAKVEKWLGSGGFADVWLLKDIASKKQYVIKHIQIKPTVKDKTKFISRIKNEAEVSIPSEYIVQSLGLVKFNDFNYGILFDFIKGESLADWIKDNKKASWKRKKELYIKILKGVSHAHKLNILHRDLKPDNILISEEDHPRIIDFGLAKFKDKSITVTGEFGGTLPYSDPEALLNGIKYVDCKCDIYALGVILHELIMGANFWILNDIEFGDFVRGLKDGKQDILDLDDGFSFPEDSVVENLLRQSTAFDSSKRIATVNDMLKNLGAHSEEVRMPTIDFEFMSPVLVIEDGSAKGSMNMIAIKDGSERQLGRNNLDATNNTISKHHAAIQRRGNQYFIYDISSRNGTFINGSKLGSGEANAIEIKHTDRIRFADLWTRFVFLRK